MWTVALLRGDDKDPRFWTHDVFTKAMCRADALAELHSCEVNVSAITNLITVDASAYYTKG